uniref:Uncharacterized protein n=1 Tax=viral metagenome TaxID=1070528 RepID=A0A6M3MFY8_9ZZZZ
MSAPIDLTAKVRIVIEMDRPGPGMKELNEDAIRVKVAMGDLSNTTNVYRTTTVSTAASVRHLLLNLRMFSFGIRTLRREFGDTNPALEAFSTALIVLSAVGSSAIAAVSLLKPVFAALIPVVHGLTFGLGALVGTTKVAIGVLGFTAGGVGAVLIALAAIPISIWAMESASGISALKRESKDLGDDLKLLEGDIASLRAEQDKFNLGMSATALRMRELKRAMDLAGEGNKALESQYRAAASEMENMEIQALKASLAIDKLKVSETETKAVQEDLLRLAAARKMARVRGASGLGEEAIFEAMKAENTMGRPSLEALQAGRERGPAGLGGIGQALSVIVNFPGAIFNTRDDIVSALEAGGASAARIIQNQYAPPGVQE